MLAVIATNIDVDNAYYSITYVANIYVEEIRDKLLFCLNTF